MHTHTESRLAELLEQLKTQLCEHASFDVSRQPSYRALKIKGESLEVPVCLLGLTALAIT